MHCTHETFNVMAVKVLNGPSKNKRKFDLFCNDVFGPTTSCNVVTHVLTSLDWLSSSTRQARAFPGPPIHLSANPQPQTKPIRGGSQFYGRASRSSSWLTLLNVEFGLRIKNYCLSHTRTRVKWLSWRIRQARGLPEALRGGAIVSSQWRASRSLAFLLRNLPFGKRSSSPLFVDRFLLDLLSKNKINKRGGQSSTTRRGVFSTTRRGVLPLLLEGYFVFHYF